MARQRSVTPEEVINAAKLLQEQGKKTSTGQH